MRPVPVGDAAGLRSLQSIVAATPGFENVDVAVAQSRRTFFGKTADQASRFTLLAIAPGMGGFLGTGTGCEANGLVRALIPTDTVGYVVRVFLEAGRWVLERPGQPRPKIPLEGIIPFNFTFGVEEGGSSNSAGVLSVLRDSSNAERAARVLAIPHPTDTLKYIIAGGGTGFNKMVFLWELVPLAGPAARLGVSGPAQLVTDRTTLSAAVTAQLFDASSNFVRTAGVPVTVSIASGTGTLSGTQTVPTAADGAAQFPDLKIIGTGAHTLKFSAAGLPDATLAVQVLPPARLEVTALPATAFRGLSFNPRISLRVADASGATVPLNLVDAQVRVASGSGALTSSSSTTARFFAGVAQFATTQIAGDGVHRLRFTVPFLDSIVSADINIVAPPVITSGPALPAATRGQPYELVLRTSVDSAGVTWSVISGTVPHGITLAPNGRLSGTPDTSAAFSFTVSATSAAFAPLTSISANLTLAVSGTASSSGPRLVVRGAPGSIRRVAADSLLCAAADTTATTCTLPTTAAVTVVAKGTPTSGFTGWQQLCTGRAACAIPAGSVQELHAIMVPLPSITTAAAEQDLLTGSGLTTTERSLLDQTGNGNGVYDIGDLMAHLERNGQSLSARVLDAVNASDVPLVRTFRAPAAPPTARVRP